MTIEPPQRQTTHRCRCILTPPLYLRSIAAELARDDRCSRNATPDAPFCTECETRHPGYPEKGFTVTSVPLGHVSST